MAALQADFTVEMELGERQPIAFTVTPDAGDTATIIAAPAYNLLDGTGMLLHGNLAITDYTSLPDAQPQAVVDFYAGAYTPALTAGEYYLQTTLVVQGSDGRTNVLTPVCLVELSGALPLPAIVATCDISTPIGKTRVYILDTNVNDAIFSDDEIALFLQDGAQIPMLAASLALEVMANDNLRLANAIRIGAYKNTSGSVYSALVERAARFRALAPVTPVVISSPAVFTRGDPSQGIVGSMDIW